jgi:hypothetical protein
MAKKRQTGQTARARRWLSALLAGLGAMFFAGCSNTPVVNVPHAHDPLHGVLVPPGMPQPTNTPKASVGWNPAPAQQFGAADSTSTNNATLAGMSSQGQLGKPLAIDDSSRTQAPGQLTGKTPQTPVNPAFLAPNPTPKVQPIPDARPAGSSWQPVQLDTPQPLADAPGVRPVVQTVGAAPPASANSDVLGKQLQDRGVINQKLDQVPDGVRLTCYVARTEGAGFRILEATAADYASAAQAIVRQLDSAR